MRLSRTLIVFLEIDWSKMIYQNAPRWGVLKNQKGSKTVTVTGFLSEQLRRKNGRSRLNRSVIENLLKFWSKWATENSTEIETT